MDQRRYFLFTSFGRTATYWLSACLHMHPDVQCSHGTVLPPELEYSEQPPDEHALNSHRNIEEFTRKSLDEVYDGFEAATSRPVVGNVHAYAAHHLTTRPQLSSPRRKIVVFNLVRHPVTRIESLARRVIHEARFSEYTRKILQDSYRAYAPSGMTEEAERKLGVDVEDLAGRSFIYALYFVPCIDRMDFGTPYEHLPMERLTRDAEYFSWIFGRAVQGAARVTGEYLDRVFRAGRMNHQAPASTAAGLYASWAPWQRDLFRIVLEKYDFPRAYGPLGYDFSFV